MAERIDQDIDNFMLTRGGSHAPCVGSPFVMIYDGMFIYQQSRELIPTKAAVL